MPQTALAPSSSATLGAFREVPFMGVIWVVHEASKLGFVNGHPDWCNLGQGQPEVGPMAGAPPRIASVRLRPEDHAYGPLGGLPELREAVALRFFQGLSVQEASEVLGVSPATFKRRLAEAMEILAELEKA